MKDSAYSSYPGELIFSRYFAQKLKIIPKNGKNATFHHFKLYVEGKRHYLLWLKFCIHNINLMLREIYIILTFNWQYRIKVKLNQWHFSVVMVRMHRAIGGVSHEHSKHGSDVFILSPTFNVSLPKLHVCSDLISLLFSMISLSLAVLKIIKIINFSNRMEWMRMNE